MCDDCIFGLSKSTSEFIYNSNIESVVMDMYNIEYTLYKNGLSDLDSEPSIEFTLNNKHLFKMFNYCPNCGNENYL